MASLPPRPARRVSPQRNSSSASSHSASQTKDTSETSPATSDDPQTILDGKTENTQESTSAGAEAKGAKNTSSSQSSTNHGPERELRKCWICFSDETEDTPGSSEWRTPCTCALTAHESCLLDWVADMEAPNLRRTAGARAKVQCPQCKSHIKLSRPRSIVVSCVRAVERISSRMVAPGMLFVSCYTIYQGFFMHGVSTVYAVFGNEDAYRILEPLYENPDPRQSLPFIIALNKAFKHFRLCSGLATIPPALVLSRSSIGDSILPILPMLFLATSPKGDRAVIDIGRWPPSAAISFALLPYLRAAYNAYYARLWAPLERKWLREIQPRNSESDQDRHGDEHRGHGLDRDDDDGGMLDVHIDVELNIWDQDEEDAAPEDAAPRQRQGPGADADVPPPGRGIAAAQAPDQADGAAPPDGAQGAPNRPALHEPRQPNTVLSIWRTSQSVLGALLFPTVAATVGSALRHVLPWSWTDPVLKRGRPTGLLQARWGRTLVGGCLFVAVRDVVLLYVRWRMAQGHKQRRVLDHPSKRKPRRFNLG